MKTIFEFHFVCPYVDQISITVLAKDLKEAESKARKVYLSRDVYELMSIKEILVK